MYRGALILGLSLLIAAIASNVAVAEAAKGPLAPAASAPVGDVVFPSAIDSKYAEESSAKARLHTCVDQYNANKANNANGGLKWIQQGGGYYSACNKRLGGISSDPALPNVGSEAPTTPAAPEATPTGPAAFPTVVDPKYAGERPSRARMRTCIDQFNKNKSTDANGGLNWIDNQGGYYSLCDKLLGGYSLALPSLTREGDEPEGSSVEARGTSYYIIADETIEPYEYKCLYRNHDKLLCPRAERANPAFLFNGMPLCNVSEPRRRGAAAL